MEVHHHPKLPEKKNWKAYIWEFLMLFLAVFCGFLAEYQLEHTIENKREKQYITSMVEDAKTDTANLQQSIRSNVIRAKYLDTLATLCLNYTASGINDVHIYRLYKYALVHPSVVAPTERTLHQLKNAGGMRLLRNKIAVDSIVLYDDISKKLTEQQTYYEMYQNKSIDIGAQIMNFQSIALIKNTPITNYALTIDTTKKLVNRDNLKIIEFGNIIRTYQGVLQFYITRLAEMNQHAIQLIKTLRREYDVKEE